jgi:glutamate carboxypeptidase
MNREQASALAAYMREKIPEMLLLLERLVTAESPSLEPASQATVQNVLAETLAVMNYRVEIIPGDESGGQLVAEPGVRDRSRGKQLLLGHSDTVWPSGTLRQMPYRVGEGIAHGPGVFDMKGGLVQMIFALRGIQTLGYDPPFAPLVFINSDEEIGSIESAPHIERLAKEVQRAFVVEPALGGGGKLKTGRKGVGQFKVTIRGKAAHAGLDPEKGASAIIELSRVIQALTQMSDLDRGISVNVGVVSGGTRVNVIPAWAEALVDIRVPTGEEARRIEQQLMGLQAATPGTTLQVEGSVNRPPLERTPANKRLWEAAVTAGELLGISLDQGTAGGGSDGNITSQFTATLDGLGSVGGGAHAENEHLEIDKMAERSALLALLLISDP